MFKLQNIEIKVSYDTIVISAGKTFTDELLAISSYTDFLDHLSLHENAYIVNNPKLDHKLDHRIDFTKNVRKSLSFIRFDEYVLSVRNRA